MAAIGVHVGQIADIIRSVYDGNATLKSLTGSTDGMFWGSAPQGSTMPYVAFNIVSIVPEYALQHLDDFHQTCRLSFSCFAKTAAAIDTLMDGITEAYGPSATIAGSDNYEVLGTFETLVDVEHITEEDVWQGTIDYELTLYRQT